MKKKTELLLPAGNFECLSAAVNAGADAVYLGLENFSARAKAQNFSGEPLKQAISFAHLRGVKVYAAVNTLIKNNELKSFLYTVAEAYEAGVDAVILQSLQFAAPILKCFEGLELHASTQMGIHTLTGAKEARCAGFSRVILSRETPFGDIEHICKDSGIEVEVFIHGAMCVSFSGGCYMSSFITGNSGNRGRCIQPCRLQYKCSDLDGGDYKLSLSDLFVDRDVLKLADAGVRSFKVEGRMRSAEYIYSAGRYYRDILDEKQPDSYIKDRLIAAFNRGDFTKGHIADCKNIASDKVSAHIGLKLGKLEIPAINSVKKPEITKKPEMSTVSELSKTSYSVKKSGILKISKTPIKTVQKHRAEISRVPLEILQKHRAGQNADIFYIKTDRELGTGDGFKVLSYDGREKGSAVYRGKVPGGVIVEAGGNARAGDILCLTKDKKYAREITEKDSRLPVDIYFHARAGELPRLKISCRGVDSEVTGAVKAQPSAGDLTGNYLRALERLGGSDFFACSIESDAAGAFVPISAVNSMRRQVCGQLSEAVLDDYNAKKGISLRSFDAAIIEDVLNSAHRCGKNDHCKDTHTDTVKNKDNTDTIKMDIGGVSLNSAVQSPPEIAVITDSADAIRELHGSIVIYKPHQYTLQDAQEFVSQAGKTNRLFLYMPTVMTHDEERLVCKVIAGAGFYGAYVNSVAGYVISREMGIKVFAGDGLNIFNDFQAAEYSGVEGFCYSKELTLREIEQFSHKDGYVFAYGDILLMTMSHCAHRALSGRRCSNCKGGGYVLSDRIGAEFPVRRVKLIRCYFELYNAKKLCGLSRPPFPRKLLLNLCGENPAACREIVTRASGGIPLGGGGCFTSGHLYRGVY